MILIFLPALFYLLNVICDAVMDTLSFKFSTSIFQKYNAQFWNPAISYLNKYVDNTVAKGLKQFSILGIKITYPAALTDAWHLFKEIRELFTGLAIVSALFVTATISIPLLIVYLVALSVIRGYVFNLLFDDVFVL